LGNVRKAYLHLRNTAAVSKQELHGMRPGSTRYEYATAPPYLSHFEPVLSFLDRLEWQRLPLRRILVMGRRN
jgi:hypothetical protein